MDTTKINPKVKFGKSLVVHGDDWQVRIFSSASQPKHPERTYHVLYENAYGKQSLEILTEAELDKRLVLGEFGFKSVEEILRAANLDHDMNYYSIGPRKQIIMKDI